MSKSADTVDDDTHLSFEPYAKKTWAVIETLQEKTNQYLQAKEITTLVDTDVTDRQVRNILTELEEHGCVTRKQRGRAHVFRPTKSIRDITRSASDVNIYEHNFRHVIHHHIDGEKKTVSVTRLTAVAEYGFDAVAEKHIHHKNKQPIDDRPSNLIPMSMTEHKATDALANMILRDEVDFEKVLEVARQVK